MLRYAIIVDDDKRIAEFSENDFLSVLKLNYDKYKDVVLAFQNTKKDLENILRYK